MIKITSNPCREQDATIADLREQLAAVTKERDECHQTGSEITIDWHDRLTVLESQLISDRAVADAAAREYQERIAGLERERDDARNLYAIQVINANSYANRMYDHADTIAALTGKIEQAREIAATTTRTDAFGLAGDILAVLTEEPQKCGCGLAFVGKLDCSGAGVLHHVEGPCYWVHPSEVSNGE